MGNFTVQSVCLLPRIIIFFSGANIETLQQQTPTNRVGSSIFLSPRVVGCFPNEHVPVQRFKAAVLAVEPWQSYFTDTAGHNNLADPKSTEES